MLISYKKPRGRFFVVGGKAQPVVEWTVIISSGANGTVSVDGVTGDYSATVPDGTVLTLSATASEHYAFTQWSDGNTDNPRTITVTSDIALSSENGPMSYEVWIYSNGNGDVSVDGTVGDYNDYCPYGTSLALEALPATDYSFDSWSDGNTSATRTVTVTGRKVLAASFQEETQYYQVNIYSSGPFTVVVDGVEGDYNESVAEGTELSVEAIIDEGSIFDSWSDGNTDNPRTLTVDRQIELTAYCHEDEYVEPTYLTVNGVQGEGTVSIDGGEPDYSVTEEVIPNDYHLIEAFPEEGYEFVEWTTQGQVSVNDPTENPTYACAGPEEAATNIVNAVFQQMEQDFNVDIHAGSNGSVTVDGDEGDYLNTVPGGTVMEIEAVPDTGYEFDSWSDGDTSNPRTLTVDNDITLAASFKEVQPNNEIWYTTSNSQTIAPYNLRGVNDNILTVVSNTYSGGKGVMKMSGDIYGTDNSFASQSPLTSLSFPSSLTYIGNGCFINCTNLASVDIPSNLTSIGASAFSNCHSLTSITIPNSVTTIGYSAFSGCSGLTSVTIGNSVTTIDSYAFKGCSGLSSVTIPNSVTSIGGNAFNGCSGLTSVTIGNSVTTINGYAFSSCTSLASVTIGNSVTSIGNYTFFNCTSLVAIESLATTAPTISNATFRSVGNNGTLTVPSGSDYSAWMSTDGYYLGLYHWTLVEQ